MGIGAGITLVAIGAILDFAVKVNGRGFNIHTVGVILMVAGVVGVLLDLLLFMPRRRAVASRGVVVDNTPTVVRRDDYV
jgi:hypothetical protein